jgi:hypothetical protein
MKLTQLDLLEISQEIRQCYAPKMSNSTSTLTLMPVAPKHLYAYWNLGDNKLHPLQESSPLPLTLRIYSASDKNNYLNKGYEDIPMSRTQSQQDIFLSKPSCDESYRASLGICFSANALEVFADSNLTQLPQEKSSITPVKADFRSLLIATNKKIYNNASGLAF